MHLNCRPPVNNKRLFEEKRVIAVLSIPERTDGRLGTRVCPTRQFFMLNFVSVQDKQIRRRNHYRALNLLHSYGRITGEISLVIGRFRIQRLNHVVKLATKQGLQDSKRLSKEMEMRLKYSYSYSVSANNKLKQSSL